MKDSFIQRKFKMNKNTTVTITSKLEGDLYKNKITLTHDSVGMEPLIKGSVRRSQLADKIADIDLADDNIEMFGEDES